MSENVVQVTSAEEFAQAIASWVVVVDFHAEWCGPCKMVGPVMEELGEDFSWKATIVKVDVDELGDVSWEFGVRSIPTVLLFKDGEKVGEPLIGAFPKEQYAKVIEGLIADEE